MNAAAEYQAQVALVGARTAVRLRDQWRRIDRGTIAGSWRRLLPVALQIVAAGQLEAAALAEPLLDATVGPGDGAAMVVPRALAGQTWDRWGLESLLTLPQVQALQQIGAGRTPAAALSAAGDRLLVMGRGAVADAARQSVAAGMGARRVRGYVRQLRAPSCYRCVILAGRWYPRSAGFARHPGCDCVHVPADGPESGGQADVRGLILSGQATGLPAGAVEAIRLGADPWQVANARRGMSTVGGRLVTAEGTTRRGIAGARILAAEEARLAGVDTDGATYRNLTFSRARDEVLRGATLRGDEFTRVTRSGRIQTAAYRRTSTMRPAPEQIISDATSADEAIRLLTNYGYII